MKKMTIDDFLKQNEEKDLLRFSTAGSVDDGKSTLIGRLLHDSKGVYEDQLASVKSASKQTMDDGEIDYALLTDGLRAEREQGITIDVAYRYFSTPKRKFIIADTPGHEQYTRNMATGASTAQLAVVLIDARLGVLTQSKRHLFIASLTGIPHIVVAVNKMDLKDYDEEVFNKIRKECQAFAAKLKIGELRFIPISALKGDNVVTHSTEMPWYTGESMLEFLENVYVGSDKNLVDLRFPVQYVSRPNLNFRGYCGQIASGVVRKGDEVMVLPSMRPTRVKSIVTYDGELECAFAPQSVTLTLADEIDISRGDMLVHPHNIPRSEHHFECMMIWMNETPLDPKKSYFVKHTAQLTRCRIDEVRYTVDVNTLRRSSSDTLALNDIGRVVLTANRKLFFDAYDRNRMTGSIVLIDAITNNTVAAGMIIDRERADRLPSSIERPAATSAALHEQKSRVSRDERAQRLTQKPATIWITGLVSSRKTDLAYALERRLFDLGGIAAVLDGENVRLGLNRDLGFTTADKVEHIRRIAETARVMNNAGLLSVCAFVSPLADARKAAAQIIGDEQYIEVYMDADADWCAAHDDTGLYEKAKAGDIENLAGVNAPYEPPQQPTVRVPVADSTIDQAVDMVLDVLHERGIYPLEAE